MKNEIEKEKTVAALQFVFFNYNYLTCIHF